MTKKLLDLCIQDCQKDQVKSSLDKKITPWWNKSVSAAQRYANFRSQKYLKINVRCIWIDCTTHWHDQTPQAQSILGLTTLFCTCLHKGKPDSTLFEKILIVMHLEVHAKFASFLRSNTPGRPLHSVWYLRNDRSDDSEILKSSEEVHKQIMVKFSPLNEIVQMCLTWLEFLPIALYTATAEKIHSETEHDAVYQDCPEGLFTTICVVGKNLFAKFQVYSSRGC